MADQRQFAVVTGASTGIGYHLARICAENGFDLAIAADEPQIHKAAEDFRQCGAAVQAVEADLATTDGCDQLYDALAGRPVDALLANVGRGLGHAFLDQDFGRIRQVVDTNVTGTLYLIHRIGNDMRARNDGRILITGSIAGAMPGAFQAVYNGTKAFLDNFAFALRNELKDSDVVVSTLMPGPTDTDFFRRADMTDTAIAQGKKDDPARVAQEGFEAMMNGRDDVVTGWKNKLQATLASIAPSGTIAEQHRKMSQPGTGSD